MCKVYTGYCGISEIEHGLCAGTVDNLSVQAHKPCLISHIFASDNMALICFLYGHAVVSFYSLCRGGPGQD